MRLLSMVSCFVLAVAGPALADDAATHAQHHPATNASTSSPQSATQPQSGAMKGCPMGHSGKGGGMMQNGSTTDGMTMHGGGMAMHAGAQMHDAKNMQCPMMKDGAPPKPAEGTGTPH